MKYSYYKVKIIGKNPKFFLKRILKLHIYLLNIIYLKDEIYIDIDYENFKRLQELKTSYEFKIIKRYGISNLVFLIRKYFIYYITMLFSLCILFLLSNIIFEVDVINNSDEIKNLVYTELKNYNISKFHFVVPFSKQEKIAKEITYNHKDKIEWMELKREGTKYTISVEQRKLETKTTPTKNRDIVAKKNGILLKIDAKTGEVVKKVNDYVKKGDPVISGMIKNKDTVKSLVSAEGKIYAEVWYTVNINMPLKYKEEYKTGRKKTIVKFSFLNKNIGLFNSYKNYKDQDKYKISSKLLPISLSITKREETKVESYDFNETEAINEALVKTDEKIEKKLREGEYIISKKVLKKIRNNSTIDVEVFYKVCEDITDYKIIEEDIDKINEKEEEVS